SRGSLSASSALGSKRFSSGSGSLDSRAGRREYPSDTESLPEAHHSYAENLDKRAAEDAQQRLRRTRSTLSKMSSMFREKSGGIGSSADSRTSSRPSTSSHSLNDRTVGSLRSVSEHNLALFVDQNLSTTPPVPSLPNISLEPTPPALPPHLQDVKPVYPALLSRVAASFVEIMHPILSTNTKNGIDYPNSFSGKEAIDAICALISTSDRALALLVGRALAKQSLFRDIVFENELEDYNHSLYAFTEEVIEKNTPSTVMADGGNEDSARTLGVPVNGVLVMLTKCYSPTCTKDNLCYSMSCPRRQEQLQEKGMAGGEQGKVKAKNWWMTVPKWLLDAVSKKVLNHQEAIFELSYTEHEY
ncbi:RHO1 GDP-GTP exchange protein 2, partial [Spiromyces aspiralis]